MAPQLCPRCHYRRHRGPCVTSDSRNEDPRNEDRLDELLQAWKEKNAAEVKAARGKRDEGAAPDPSRCNVKACPYPAVIEGKCRACYFAMTSDVSLYASSLGKQYHRAGWH
jgi:hypothetical protein